MSVPPNVFPNARSPLFGEGEDSIGVIDTPAVAGLSGSPEDSIGVIDTPAVAGLSGSNGTTVDKPLATIGYTIVNPLIGITWGGDEFIISSSPITITESINFLILFVTLGISYNDTSGTRTGQLRLRFNDVNGTLLDEVAITNTGFFGPVIFQLVIQNAPLTATSVVLTIKNNTSFITDIGNRSNVFYAISVVNIDDTHQGIITTPATATKQINAVDSHQGIIATPATATKQINAVDSHRTHEQSVLPA